MNNLLLSGSVAALLLGGCASSESDKQRPNVIYFLVDDMGVGDLSLYGQTEFDTPNIDKLAADGMVFSSHYCGSTVSGPSRAALMTGKHTGRNTVRGNQPMPQVLGDDEMTIAKVLKGAGYTTACIGKWGIGHPVPLDDPQKKGFDISYGYLNMWHAHNCFPEFLYRNGVKEMLQGNRLRLNEDGSNPWANMPEGTGIARTDAREQFAPNLFAKEALKFINDNKENPFFLYYAINLPHANNEAAPNGMEVPSFGEFADRSWPDAEKGFAQMMRIIDNQMGAFVAELERLGIADNTIIMFASDNGAHEEGGHKVEFFNSNGETRGAKRAMYDGGIHTPFIVRWGNVIPAGSSTDHLSAFWDILPTFCEITGQETPEGVDGISMLPTLKGDNLSQAKHDYLYYEFYEEGGKQAVVTDEWKYVKLNLRGENGAKMVTELYNLNADPEEQRDVLASHPDIVKQMEVYIKEGHTPFALTSLFSDDGSDVNMDHD